MLNLFGPSFIKDNTMVLLTNNVITRSVASQCLVAYVNNPIKWKYDLIFSIPVHFVSGKVFHLAISNIP